MPSRVVRAVDGRRGWVPGRVEAAGRRGRHAVAPRGRRSHILPICGDPVPRLLPLRRPKRKSAFAHQVVQAVLQNVLRSGAPTPSVGLRPQVPDRVRAAELKGDQMIHLMLVRDPDHTVSVVDRRLLRFGDVARRARVAGCADTGSANRQCDARGERVPRKISPRDVSIGDGRPRRSRPGRWLRRSRLRRRMRSLRM